VTPPGVAGVSAAGRPATATPATPPPTPRRLGRVLAVVGLLVAAGCAAALPVRATYGAQTTADEPQYLLSAISLAEDGDLDIADELAAERWRAFHQAPLPEQTKPLPGGRRLSPHEPLLPLLLALPVAAGGWVAAKLAMAVAAGALAMLLVWTAVRRLRVPLAAAVTVTLAVTLAPPLAVYGTQLYPELPAALATLAGVAAVSGPLRRRRPLLVLTGAVVALPWLGTKYAPVAAALAVLGLARLVRAGRLVRAAAVAAALAGAGLVFLAAHQVIYGGWTPYAVGDHFVTSELGVVGFEPDYLGRSRRLLALLVDRGFGLAAWQPAWLLAVPALAALVRRRPDGWTALLAPAVAGWLTATFVALTMHGWWFPGRQLVVVLPLVALVLAWWVGSSGRRLAAVALLGAGGVAAYAWLAVEGARQRLTWVVDFAATVNPGYRAWRLALPDYMTVTRSTWILHAVWLAVLAAAAVWGWRTAGPSGRAAEPASRVASQLDKDRPAALGSPNDPSI
jgi:hypothetical protein